MYNDEEKGTASGNDMVPWSDVTFQFARGKQYLSIAKEYLEKAQKSAGNQHIIVSAGRQRSGWAKVEWDIRQENLVIISVIFSALAAEALINEYALLNLPKDHFKKYLSRLSFFAKWVIIPKIVTGKGIQQDSPAMSQLDKLIILRNTLVHDKPVKRQLRKINTEYPPDIVPTVFAKKGIETVIGLFRELESLGNHKLPEFK